MGEEHYLGNARLVGEQVRYVAEYQGRWVGLLAWSAGAYGLKLREEWIGWNPAQKKRRLSLVANNSRFLILGGLPRAQSGQPADEAVLATAQPGLDRSLWARGFGSREFRGSAGSSWAPVTRSAAGPYWGKRRATGAAGRISYLAHDRPKQLWVRELRPGARTVLRGAMRRKPCAAWRQPIPPNVCKRPRNSSRWASISRGFPIGASASRTFRSAA